MLGGDIKGRIFSKILSIGYELEASGFSKASLIDKTLLITDNTNKKYKDDLKHMKKGEDTLYPHELFDIPLYKPETLVRKKKKMKNSEFLVTNDVAVTPFTKYLTKLCKEEQLEYKKDEMDLKVLQDEIVKKMMSGGGDEIEEEIADDEIAESSDESSDEGSDESSDESSDEDYEEKIMQDFKNTLYTFKTDDDEYNIRFEALDDTDCGVITNTEWIFTFFHPAQDNENIILDTFFAVVRNLKHHLDKLTYVEGTLVMKLQDSEEEIPKPLRRKLYHLPGTNLHYLQTYFIDEEQTTDDICVVPQMTFSCNASDIIEITKTMAQDTLEVTNDDHTAHHEQSQERLELIIGIENIINDLVTEYNKTTSYKLDNDESILSFKGFLFLFLFKMSRYFNNYLVDIRNKKKVNYFKDKLFINARHSNYNLYIEMKKCFEIYYKKRGFDTDYIIQDIQKLVIRPTILLKLLDSPGNIRRGAFNYTTRLKKDNENYGNPQYSLGSYFDYFEDSLDNVEDESILIRQEYYDWFRYEKDMDSYSGTSVIENGVVLTEMRMFGKMMSLFINSVNDPELLEELYSGACNRATGKSSSYSNAFTIKALFLFAELYETYGYGKRKKKKTQKKLNKYKRN